MRGDPAAVPVWKDCPLEVARLLPTGVIIRRGLAGGRDVVVLYDGASAVWCAVTVPGEFDVAKMKVAVGLFESRHRDELNRMVVA